MFLTHNSFSKINKVIMSIFEEKITGLEKLIIKNFLSLPTNNTRLRIL
jgi:hypothetical protein